MSQGADWLIQHIGKKLACFHCGSLVGMLLGGLLADYYGSRITAVIFGIMTFIAILLSF